MAGKKRRLIAKLCALAIIVGIASSQTVFAFDEEENKNEQQRLQQQADQYQKQLEETQNDIKAKQKYAEALQGKISTLSKQISLSNQKIKALNEDIKKQQAQIDEKLKSMESQLDSLRKRLCAIYKAGDTSSLEIILGAKDFSDFVDKAELIKYNSEHDEKMIKEIQSQIDSISKQQEKLEQQKLEVTNEKKSLEKKKKEINKLSEENSKLISELRDKEQDTLDSIGENEDEVARLEQELQDFYEQQRREAEEAARRRIEEARKAAEERRNQQQSNNGGNEPDDENNNGQGNSGGNQGYVSGEYVWPCPGFYYLTSLFDEDRGSNNHGALDIAGGGIYGAEVVAARDGVVVSSYDGCVHDYGKSESCGCGGGYGNYVVIEHADGKTSLYGHLSGVTVSYGDYVSAGQLIGYVGSTGYSTGPHLHFETKYQTIWDHSYRYNPLDEYPGIDVSW